MGDDLISDVLDIPADIADELENLIEETPNAGGELEEIADEIEGNLEDLADKLAELSDASAEITAKIVEASKAEKITAKLDEERGDVFDELDEEIDDAIPAGRGGAILGALLFFGSAILLMQRFSKRDIDARPAPIDNHIVVKSTQTIDAHGMVS